MPVWILGQVNQRLAQYRKRIGIFALLVTTILSSFPATTPVAQATVAKYINFQGKLTKVSDGTNVTNGSYAFEFKLYDASTSGTLLWTETYDQPSGACGKLTVTNGVFNTKLGSCNSLASIDFTGGSMYVSVNFAPTGTSYDGEMSPRKQLVAAPYALVANSVSGDGPINTVNSSTTALTVAKSGSNYGLQVDTSAASAATGLKVTSAAAAGGIALSAISSGTNESLTLDAKGTGTVSIGATSTGDILLGGGSGSTGCTITNSTGALACTAGGSFTTLGLTGAITGATGFNGLVVTANTGVITTGTWNATAIGSQYGGTGQNFSASSGLPSINSGTWQTNTITQNGVAYGGASNAMSFTAQGGANTVLVANAGAPSFSAAITVGTSVTSPTINASTVLQTGGTNRIDSSGNLTNIGNINVSGAASTFTIKPNTASALVVTDGTNNYYAIDSRTTNSTSSAHSFTTAAPTIASAAGAQYILSTFTPGTFNFSGTTAITTGGSGANTSVLFNQPLLNATGSGAGITVSEANNVYIKGSPAAQGASNPLTITNAYALRIAAPSNAYSGGTITNGYGLRVDADNTATNNYAAVFTGGNVGIGTATPARALDVFSSNAGGAVVRIQEPSPRLDWLESDAATDNKLWRMRSNNEQWLISAMSDDLFTTTDIITVDRTGTSIDQTQITNGNLAVGAVTASAKLHVLSTGEQLRLGYDPSNYTSLTTSSAGALSIQPSGFIANVGGGTTRTALRFLEPSGTGTDYAAIQSNANVTTSYTWTLPAADASGCIQSNGAGVLSIGACGGGSLTPWTSAIDADGYALQDALNIEFRTAAGSAPAGSVIALYADNSGDLTANVLTGKTYNVAVNGTDEYNFSSTALAMNSNNITGLGTALTAAAGLTVTATAADLALVTATSGNITLAPASTGSVQITSGVTTGTTTTSALSLAANSLTTGTGLYTASSSLTSGKLVDLQVSGTAAAASQTALNILTTGANGTAGITTYGAQISNTHSTNTSTNVALQLTATGGATANYALLTNGGNVGIGDTSPVSLFTVGSGDLFQINTSGQISSQVTSGPISDYLVSLAGTTGNNNSRIIDITQANNDATEDSTVINIVNTANAGTIPSAATRNIKNIYTSLTPTATFSTSGVQATANIYGMDNNVALTNVSIPDVPTSRSRTVNVRGASSSVSADMTISDNNGGSAITLNTYGMYGAVTSSPTFSFPILTSTTATYAGGYFNNTVSSAGDANFSALANGIMSFASGNLTTTGATSHAGGYFDVSGTALNNYGLQIASVTAGTNNYGLYIDTVASGATNYAIYSNAAAKSYFAGNVGIGTTAPSQKLHVADGITLINSTSSFTPTTLGGADLSIGVNAVVASGKYMYLGLNSAAGNDFRIYDTHNTSSPTSVGGVDVSTDVRTVFIAGKYAYIGLSSDGGSGNEFRIYDISNPNSPTSVGGFSYNQNLLSIYVQGRYAYLGFAGDNSTGTEFKIYDISNPTSPAAVGAIDTAGASGAAGGVKSVYVQGKYAYLGLSAITGTCSGSTATGCEFRIYDVSDPLNPAYVSGGGVDPTVDVNSVAVSGKYAYLGLASVSGNDLRIYDIANPGSPSSTGGLDLSTGVNTLQVQGKYIYLGLATASGNDFRIIDASDPTSPSNVGGVDASTDVNGLFINGKYAYIGLSSVSGNDFRIIDIAGIDTQTITTGAAGIGQLSVTDNARIDNDLYVGTGINVGVGGIQSSGGISIENSVLGSGANAIAGLYGSYTMTNSTASGFQFGNRFINTISSGTAGTHDGEFIRMIDNTSLSTGQVVRGLEVQAWSGTNNNGINTGIATFGKTFGVHAATSAQAGGVSQPAAVFADLDNGSATTAGNAIRAYTDNATSADLVSIYQETSAYTGNGLVMNFGNNSGSFTGNFIDLQIAGSSKYSINFNNSSNIITQTFARTASIVDYASATNGNTFIWKIPQKATTGTCATTNAEGVIFQNTGGTQVGHICIDGPTSGTPNKLRFYAEQFNGTSTDVAENYSDSTNTLEAGDVVSFDSTTKKGVVKTTRAYDNGLAGVISTAPGVLLSGIDESTKATDLVNPKPLALSGRVPVKVTTENGSITVGDYVTSSATMPGYAMKATKPGQVIGQALQILNNGIGTIEVFVDRFYYDPSLALDENGNINLQYGQSAVTVTTQTTDTAAYVIKQKGSGTILQLQDNETDRLLVASSGSMSINAKVDTGTVLSIANNNTSLFTISATGNATIAGTIIVKKDVAVLGRILGSTAIVGKNTSSTALHQGDVVMLTGATDVAVLGDQPTVTIAAAVSGTNNILVGIVDRNLSDFALDDTTPAPADPTTINPGEFASIVISGTYKKVMIDGSAAMGDKLTAGQIPGHAQKLDSTTSGQVFAISLDNVPQADGSIRVMLLNSFQQSPQTITQSNNNGSSTPNPTPTTDNLSPTPPASDPTPIPAETTPTPAS